MEERIRHVISSTLGIGISEINDATSPETVEEWDSLKHILLVIALEKEFRIKFEPKEILKLLSYTHILEIIKRKTSCV